MSSVDLFASIAHGLTTDGYSVSDGLLDSDHVAALGLVAESLQQQGRTKLARTGKVKAQSRARRGDSIAWLDEDSAESSVVECLERLDALRQSLNRQLFLNLHELESHFAIYPPGAGYEKHLDQFASGDQSRQVSMVLYLNQDWRPSNGGALRLHLSDSADDTAASAGEHLDISPIGGRLVLFLSSKFWHEVLPSDQQRLSLTGWFRTRSVF